MMKCLGARELQIERRRRTDRWLRPRVRRRRLLLLLLLLHMLLNLLATIVVVVLRPARRRLRAGGGGRVATAGKAQALAVREEVGKRGWVASRLSRDGRRKGAVKRLHGK